MRFRLIFSRCSLAGYQKVFIRPSKLIAMVKYLCRDIRAPNGILKTGRNPHLG